MSQKVLVHLFPTDKPSTLGINKDTGHMYQFDPVVSHEGRYLYFTSDEDVNENDKQAWDDYLRQVVELTPELYAIKHTKMYRKIVATTNKDLLLDYNKEGDGGYENFPCIPESFINLYVERYNAGNPIKEVELEVIGWDDCPKELKVHCMTESSWGVKNVGKLKLDSQGCVIVKVSRKETFTREEVLNIMSYYGVDAIHGYKEGNIPYYKEWLDKNHP